MSKILKFSDFESRNLQEEEEGKSYLQKLQNISQQTEKLMELISDNEELEAWVQDKITIAEHNIEAILGYYQSSKKGGTDMPLEPNPNNPELKKPTKPLFDRKWKHPPFPISTIGVSK